MISTANLTLCIYILLQYDHIYRTPQASIELLVGDSLPPTLLFGLIAVTHSMLLRDSGTGELQLSQARSAFIQAGLYLVFPETRSFLSNPPRCSEEGRLQYCTTNHLRALVRLVSRSPMLTIHHHNKNRWRRALTQSCEDTETICLVWRSCWLDSNDRWSVIGAV